MNASNNQPTCPICGDGIKSSPQHCSGKLHLKWCDCARCGKFTYSDVLLENTHFESVRHLVSAWIRSQVNAGKEFPAVPPDGISGWDPANDWLDSLKYAGFPQTVTEKLDALLQAYADIAKDEISERIKPVLHPHLIPEIAARNHDEVNSLNILLKQLDYIDLDTSKNLAIKAEGWKRIDQMQKSISYSDSAFIAMWYHDSMKDYRDSAIAAVQHCGYKPLIIDLSEFNDFIMDKVVAMVREARFLIADLTCKPEIVDVEGNVKQGVRGGVYWEAGMAYGMGKTFILTCEDNEDCKRRRHFDLKQYNTIFWKQDKLSNFEEDLAQHILATIGKGTYQTDEADKKKLPPG